MSQTGVIAWSQTASSNANSDSTVNWAEGMSPASVNDSARATMASVAKWRDDLNGSITTSGTSTAYTVTTNQVQAALTAGYTVSFSPHTASGTTVTLNVDGLGAKPLRPAPGVELSAPLSQGTPYTATYFTSNSGEWVLNNYHIQPPTGSIIGFAGSSAPTGWLVCDGSAVSRTTYAALFAVISTTYGAGDSSTTFNIPDLGGRVIAGKEATATRLTSSGSGVDGGTLAASGGVQTHTLALTEIPAHSHSVTDPGHTHKDAGPNTTGASASSDLTGAGGTGGSTSSETTGITINNAGGGLAHTNVQPTLVLNYIIKT